MNNIITHSKLLEMYTPRDVIHNFCEFDVDSMTADEYVLNNENTMRHYIIRKFDISNETAKILTKAKCIFVRQAIAENTDDEEVLNIITKDDEMCVRLALIQHHYKNEKLLRTLINDNSWIIRAVVADCTGDEEKLKLLVNDKDWRVLYQVILNNKTPDEILMILCNNNDQRVKYEAIKKLESRGYNMKIKWAKEY